VARGLRHSTRMSPDASWSFEPGPILVLTLATVVYVRRWHAVRASPGRLALFLGGILCAALALVSPIDRLGEQLFFMHMIQHVLLLDISVVLCLLGLTKVILRPATRRLVRVEEALGPVGHPVFALCAYVGVMWFWHIPPLYDAAVEVPVVHVLEHMTFLLAGGLYWWHLLSPIRSRKRLAGMGPVVYMAATKVLVGGLGVMLSFLPNALYSAYTGTPDLWGLSALEDQQVGGLIMATEQSILMGIALAWLFVRALAESDREDERAERYGPA
jgi:putative membrane protein